MWIFAHFYIFFDAVWDKVNGNDKNNETFRIPQNYYEKIGSRKPIQKNSSEQQGQVADNQHKMFKPPELAIITAQISFLCEHMQNQIPECWLLWQADNNRVPQCFEFIQGVDAKKQGR